MCSIHVSDPAHAHRFYTDVLGFQTVVEIPEHHVYVVRAPGQDVGLLLEPRSNPIAEAYASGLRAENMPVIVLSTSDLDAEVVRLQSAGVEFVGGAFDDASGRHINFDDSVGNLVQLHQPA